MIQGGDPTGTGRGGESKWGHPFPDELSRSVLHSSRGTLSMANSGPLSNNSQFFILFAPAPHLNQKHTVFGKLVGGADVLNKLEQVPTDSNDRPLESIIIEKATVYVDPFDEEEMAKEKAEENEKKAKKELDDNPELGQWYSNPQVTKEAVGTGVGKYIKPSTKTKQNKRVFDFGTIKADSQPKKRTKTTSYKDAFSRW